jgi:predicted alpha/beta-fold hydrolase
MHGFRSAQDYYERCSSRQFVDRIETPTLVLHAADDPLMHSGVIPPPEERSAHVAFEVSPNGGHVGFVSGSWPWSAQYWLEDRIPKFLQPHIAERDPRMGLSDDAKALAEGQRAARSTIPEWD